MEPKNHRRCRTTGRISARLTRHMKLALPQTNAPSHSQDRNSLFVSVHVHRLTGGAVPKSIWQKRLLANSVLFPCRFPGRLRIACVYASLAIKVFLAGKICLLNSLPREFVMNCMGQQSPDSVPKASPNSRPQWAPKPFWQTSWHIEDHLDEMASKQRLRFTVTAL